MKLSINPLIIDKNVNKIRSQSIGFVATDLTVEQLTEHVRQGHSWSFHFKNNYRKTANFLCSDVIAADIDHGMTLDEALADPFVQKNACLIYTSASHRPDAHRFRIVFETPYTVTDVDQIRCALRGLIRKFQADGSAKDAARQFYGSRDCFVHLPGGRLDDTDFELLLELGALPLNISDSPNKAIKASSRSSLLLEPDQYVRTAQGDLSLLKDMEPTQSIFCPFHNDSQPSAFTTRSRHGVMGIHCSSCQLTFWPQGQVPPAYDFFAFDKLAEQQAQLPPELFTDELDILYDIPNPNKVLSQRYLDADVIGQFDGITLIKSPKGSGKTEYLEQVVHWCRHQKLRVLLIGHRRALIRALAARLGLHCYLDDKIDHPHRDYLAICVDSLVILNPAFSKFQVILIDESEQVFSHLLSETMDNDKRRQCYLILRHYIEVAQQVIALDADMNEVTLYALQRFSEKKHFAERRLILNRHRIARPDIALYADEQHLIDVFMADAASGRRLFVCCNTKKQVETFTQILQQQLPALSLLSITSANVQTPAALEFVRSPVATALKYQVVMVSPAVSSGIDITFDGNASLIECVYGFFQPLVNAHYDIDQQLSRVRHPGDMRLWITPQRFNFESEVEPIYQELAVSGLFPQVQHGFTRSGVPCYVSNEPFIRLYATILASQRASKNDLRHHIRQLREYNGWSFTVIERDKQSSKQGRAIEQIGQELRLNAYIESIMAVDPLDRHEADELLSMRERSIALTADQQLALDRYFLEAFYHKPASPHLIAEDREGRWRDNIRFVENVFALSPSDLDNPNPNNCHWLFYEIMRAARVMTDSKTFATDAIITLTRLTEFVAYCKTHKVRIEPVLDVEIRKDIDKKPVSQLNAFLRLCGLSVDKYRTVAVGKNKIYEYRLTPHLPRLMHVVETRRKARVAEADKREAHRLAVNAIPTTEIVQPIDN